MNLLELQKEAERRRIERNSKINDKYKFLRKNGFSSKEAIILQHKKRSLIDALIKEKKENGRKE